MNNQKKTSKNTTKRRKNSKPNTQKKQRKNKTADANMSSINDKNYIILQD